MLLVDSTILPLRLRLLTRLRLCQLPYKVLGNLRSNYVVRGCGYALRVCRGRQGQCFQMPCSMS
jgi:hypothetical protein